jgi:hypothetical protein
MMATDVALKQAARSADGECQQKTTQHRSIRVPQQQVVPLFRLFRDRCGRVVRLDSGHHNIPKLWPLDIVSVQPCRWAYSHKKRHVKSTTE